MTLRTNRHASVEELWSSPVLGDRLPTGTSGIVLDENPIYSLNPGASKMPRRSRGCAACRQRRIGCDGGLPSCRQCLITNRQCSGPLQGALIIDQTERVRSKNGPKSAHNPDRSLRLYQPSSRPIFAYAFISEFVSFITARNEQARRQSWLTEIQRGSIVDEGLALELSMQATALAYCGSASSNPAAVREACNVYGRALSNHSKSIAQDLSSLRAASLCTCVMLSIFEAICATNPLAYGTHLRAAQKMLMLVPRDEDNLHMQVTSQLGQHVRSQTLFVMIASPEQYVEFTPEATNWAESGHNTADVVERLINCVSYLGDTLARKTCNINTENALNTDIGHEIGQLWDEFREEAKRAGDNIQLPTSPHTQSKDPFTTMIMAYFAASQALLNILNSQPIPGKFLSLESSCHDILHCAYALQGKNLGCAYLRMFFPLMLVGVYGPSATQRAVACEVLGQWLHDTAFKGMGKLAFSRVQSQNLLRSRQSQLCY